MSKLVVDRVQCLSPTDKTDDLYFVLMRFDSKCTVRRVGPRKTWADLKFKSDRKRDIVLTKDFSGEYFVATVEQDAGTDFDTDTMRQMSKALRYIYSVVTSKEPDWGRRLSSMFGYFSYMLEKMRWDDDLLSVQIISGPENMHVQGEGAEYWITLKTA
jgi:hypothetical protein